MSRRRGLVLAARGERLSEAARQEGPAVELTWSQAVLGVDYWAVPRAR